MSDTRAVFLDRDGTIIEDRQYLADPGAIAFIPGAVEALRMLRDAGYQLVVATNQSGIARGLYSVEQYRTIEARMEDLLRSNGVVLDGVYFCPHHPDFTGPCECRKPLTGMFREAERNLGLDLASSVYVGDRLRDVQPALELGGLGILVLTGSGEAASAQVPDGIEVVADLREAAHRIVEKNRAAP
jgi:D-glycero-D-manno-heptose 1,7-bisphosphate phosphatase